jgi:hypothetical protein
MSARVPHLLTRLLSSDDLDALETAMLTQTEPPTWPAAVQMIRDAREASFQRRSKLTPSARRKSLGLRYTR